MISEVATLRVLDASLNRASEGLRVVEDYARFAMNDGFVSGLAKELRHDLAKISEAFPHGARLASRDTLGDVGTVITTDSEATRSSAWDVCVASQERLQQALRSLEEYSKVVSPAAAARFERIRYRAYTLGKALAARRRSSEALAGVRLFVLLDGGNSPEGFESLAASIAEAGADAIQLRDKRLDGRDLVERARRLVRAAHAHGVIAIVNDRADVAAASGADGVHVGQDDLAVADARAIVGPEGFVGVSTHSLEQLRRAALDGADYVGLGPTFPSSTKSFDDFPGLEYLRSASEEIAMPAFAIGGIMRENLPDVFDAGATRIAVASAITAAADPAAEVKRLKSMLPDNATTSVGG